MRADIPIDISPLVQYVVVSQHRGLDYRDKSRWLVSMQEEVDCFRQSLHHDWLMPDAGWGLIVDAQNNLMVLGINYLREESKVAKFVEGNGSSLWHGYPADLKRKVKDIPPTCILEKWYSMKLIRKHHLSRIRRGIRCNL
ncbi:MAG: hypothetical protein HZA28_08270 [Candidatus Omnitrophica bacterium]|nr:hypothetical protein [Candidatus Omnitrophota bacterium]